MEHDQCGQGADADCDARHVLVVVKEVCHHVDQRDEYYRQEVLDEPLYLCRCATARAVRGFACFVLFCVVLFVFVFVFFIPLC